MQSDGTTDRPQALKSQTYRFTVDGTRPVLQFDLSSGAAGGPEKAPEKLVIELHSPISGEVFEARTSIGRIEVDRDGRVMYFCLKGEDVGFTLFVGRSISVNLSRSSGEAVISSPSKMLSFEKSEGRTEGGDAPSVSTIRLKLE